MNHLLGWVFHGTITAATVSISQSTRRRIRNNDTIIISIPFLIGLPACLRKMLISRPRSPKNEAGFSDIVACTICSTAKTLPPEASARILRRGRRHGRVRYSRSSKAKMRPPFCMYSLQENVGFLLVSIVQHDTTQKQCRQTKAASSSAAG